MKKFLSLGLLALSLGSATKVSADATSFLYGGATVGWTNVIQSVESHIGTGEDSNVLLTEGDFDLGEDNENTVRPAPAKADEIYTVTSATPLNQTAYTQNFTKFTPVYPTSRAAGNIFLGGECRNENHIFQAQFNATWVGGGEQQKFTYDVTKQSVVNSEIDEVIMKDGTAFQANQANLDNYLEHKFNYNGSTLLKKDLTIQQYWGFDFLLGWGLQSGDLGLVFNVGYSGAYNKARLNYFSGELAFSSDDEDKPKEQTAEQGLWRNGIVLGCQLIWKLNSSFDALLIYQKTFYPNQEIKFEKFGKSNNKDNDDGENNGSSDNMNVSSSEYLYGTKETEYKSVVDGTGFKWDDGKVNSGDADSASSEVTGNTIDSYLERSYVGFGLRFKVGAEE